MSRFTAESSSGPASREGSGNAVKADQQGILTPYKVATWSTIPASSKAADATYYADYGGYVAIGYNSAKVKKAPTSLKSLLDPAYKKEVAINGNPTQAGAAFAAVYAAALANGGSFSNIAPGVAYFKKLHQAGNFVPVTASAATMESGQTPIIIWWDYLLASEVGPGVPGLKIVIPSDAHYAAPGKLYAEPATAFVAEFVGTMNRIPGELDGDGRVRLLGATLPVKGERPVGQDKVDALVRPESLRMTAVPDGTGIVTVATFLGSLTRVSVLLPGDVTVQVDQPSAEAAVMLPGTSVQVSVAQAPVLVTTRR